MRSKEGVTGGDGGWRRGRSGKRGLGADEVAGTGICSGWSGGPSGEHGRRSRSYMADLHCGWRSAVAGLERERQQGPSVGVSDGRAAAAAASLDGSG
jgi:hypothetical protein